LGAQLNNLFDPGEAMRHCQEIGGILDTDAYRAWHMGQGMAVITPEPDKAIAEAQKYGIEAQLAGFITPERGIRLASRGSQSPGKELAF
jgi:phosphoribosylaminoimidazole (AIR) synthetase